MLLMIVIPLVVTSLALGVAGLGEVGRLGRVRARTILAQVFRVELSLGARGVVVLMTVLTAIGTAGVPGGSIPLLAMVLDMVGVPAEGIAVILGRHDVPGAGRRHGRESGG